MQIRNRLNQFRFYISWKYPLFYDRVCATKFPLQLLALSLVTIVCVSFYNAHYSFAASAKNSRKTNTDTIALANTSEVETESPIVNTESNQASSQDLSYSPTSNSPIQLEAALKKSEEVLQQQVLKAETLLREKKQQTRRLEEKVESARNLLRTSEMNLPSSITELEIYNAEWMLELPEDHYVVQIASATEQQTLLQYAADKSFNAPLAIFPFKVNKNGELVYGLSTGLFIEKDDATTELPMLSKISTQHGVWVRKVAEIKQQLVSLKQSKLLQ